MAKADSTIALVTGANQGIGYAVSKRLASDHGFHVIMTGRREEAVNEAARSLQDEGLDVEAYPMDLSSDQSIDAVVQNVERYNSFHSSRSSWLTCLSASLDTSTFS